jgi:2-methylaconitate cis-trans-isomerase PrpF
LNVRVKALAVFSAFLLLVGLVYAVSYIWSPPVTVTVLEYSLSLSASPTTVIKYENVTFTGRLTLDGTGVSGVTVELFFTNGTSTGLTAVTNSTGYYIIEWNATQVGALNFKTRAFIP